MYDSDTFYDWITQAESAYGKAKTEYEDAGDYYENEQEPSDVPTDKEYVTNNIITDTIDRSVGQLISGDVTPVLVGGGPLSKAAKELHTDILEANFFKESILPEQGNHFYNQGLGGFKFVDNPFKKSKYGIGFAEIYGLNIGDLWLDPNSRSGMHTDDKFRINPVRLELDYARNKFARYENGRKNTKMWNDITESAEQDESQTTEPRYCWLYEIEFKKSIFSPITLGDGTRVLQEQEVFYIAKMINKSVQVMAPTPTGYPCFRLIPMIHTARKNLEYGRYPFGLYKKLGKTQDRINVTASVILEAVKAQIKQTIVIKGAKKDEEEQARQEFSKTNGLITIKSPQAKTDVYAGTPIPPALVQYFQMERDNYDDIKGSSNQAQQFQSAASGQLSGKAIGNLQFASTMPEYTKKANVEFALSQLSHCIFWYIKRKMGQPFTIERTIEGRPKQIRYNQQAEEGFQEDDYNVVSDQGVINDLSELGEFDVKVQVEMNSMQRQEIEMNKALILAQAGKIADKDLLKKLYPNEWKELYDNIVAQGGAMALVEKMSSYGQDFVNLMAGMIDKYAKQFNIEAQKKAG
jgi:hypothetical protein